MWSVEAILVPNPEPLYDDRPDSTVSVHFTGSYTTGPYGESYGDVTRRGQSCVGIVVAVPFYDRFAFGIDVVGLSLDLSADSTVTSDSSVAVAYVEQFIPMVTPYLSYAIPFGNDNRFEFFGIRL